MAVLCDGLVRRSCGGLVESSVPSLRVVLYSRQTPTEGNGLKEKRSCPWRELPLA